MRLEKQIELLEELLLEVLVDVNHAENGAYSAHIHLLEQIRGNLIKEKAQIDSIKELADK